MNNRVWFAQHSEFLLYPTIAVFFGLFYKLKRSFATASAERERPINLAKHEGTCLEPSWRR